MNPIARPNAPGSLSPEQIADLIQEVYDANGLVADEVDRLLGSRVAVSGAIIDRFTRLADRLRPGASARAELSALDPSLLLAGTSVWMARRHQAANRASASAAVWSGDATLGESA
jgi:hypothetical protein